MSVKDTLRMALYDAIDWQTSLADAYSKDDPERKNALDQAKKYRAILTSRYRVTTTPMEKLGENAKMVNIEDIRGAAKLDATLKEQ